MVYSTFIIRNYAMFVSFINFQVLYVLQLYQDSELGQASFTSITDHLLTQSILSFVITGSVQPQLDDDPSNSDLSDEDDISALAKFDSRKNIAIIRLHCIQTKCVVCLSVCLSV